jgi:glycosyltransferase involved in cell wall biosynthesis
MTITAAEQPSRDTSEFFKGRRILAVSATFPPDIVGGAEVSAFNIARWLQQAGAEVGVLTTAKRKDETCAGKLERGMKIWRVWMPRPYPFFDFTRAPRWAKPIWHLQDHFDPRNKAIVGDVLDSFRPQHANIHILQGLGYNVLPEFGKRDIPVLYFLHDLGLACVRMSMFKSTHACPRQCSTCTLSAKFKRTQVATLPRLAYCSPSKSNLDRLAKVFPLEGRLHTSIMNPNRYPAATAVRTASETLRILYVGRIHFTKGVHLLLQAADELAANNNLSVTIIGSGPHEAELREKYGSKPWCRFLGFLPHQEISNVMVNSDVLCSPSVWEEPFPGVAVHALSLGLPVLGSKAGGIPEIIEDGKTGALFVPGDASAIREQLRLILADRAVLEGWRANALAGTDKFDPERLAARIGALIQEVARN